MPRLRTPSMKVRQNMESLPLDETPSTSTRRTSTRAAAGRTPAAAVAATPTTSATSSKRPRGRPKGSKTSAAKKKTGKPGRPRTNKKGKPWEDDPEEEQYFGYESYSSSSDGGEDDEFYPDLAEPILPEEEEHVDHHHDDFPHVKQDSGEELEGAILCPWLEYDQVDELSLPESSHDIPVINDYVMDMIEMYELLRSYSRTLRLTPFIFEDFCAAMSSPENSCLLAEVHIALLKACLRSDDEEQVHYSANDSNNAVNIAIFSLDSMTYAEVLRMYLEGDRARGRVPIEILNAISTPNYPFVPVDVRASVITYLCYRFLDTTEYKKIVNGLGKLASEEACRVCSKSGGELVSCGNCELSFHPNCISLTEREQDWVCELCNLNTAKGVSSCLPLDQVADRQPLRMTPIGRDRHGRIYWFVVRRIIIQEEEGSGLWYYSTAPQLYELVKKLDPTYYEYQLCKTLNSHLPDILEQMSVTVELTNEKNQAISTEQQSKNRPLPPAAYLQNDNINRMYLILTDPEVQAKKEEQEVESEEDENVYQTPSQRILPMMGVSYGSLVNNFWSGGYEEKDVLSFDLSTIPTDPANLFCMGQFKWDDTFKKYKNNYALHDYGEPTAVKKKAADRKKYLATRFTLLEEGEDAFKWSMAKGKDMYGPERQQTKYLEWTIGKLLKKVPTEMMHRRWPEVADQWRENLAKAETFQDLSQALLKAECCMRRTLFLPQFWNSLGVTRLTRTTIDDREQISKDIQKRKKDEKDLSSLDYSDEGVIKVNYTRLATKACPQGLWRQKDEIFRVCGRGELGGWIWVSRTLTRRIRSLPERPPLGLCDGGVVSEEEKKKPAVKKALRLDALAQKLMGWRENEERTKQQIEISRCYSPNCRSGFSKRLVCGDEDVLFQSCYSSSCRNSPEVHVSYPPTSAIAKARDVSRITPVKNEVLGERDEKWPLNEPTSFSSKKSGKKSILIIPDLILRKIARQGGRLAIYIPNFSMSAKSNYSLWNYPCLRPCFDLCWKWLTTNARSLHAVSLQLKILWYCIKWTEFLPAEDDSDDGRVIVHHPDRDELRQVVRHKEFPPQGTYERYMLKVESVMLDDEGDDDDFTEKDRKRRRENNRPKRAAARLASQRRNPTRFEWIDGVELKVFEIRQYWQGLNYEKKESEKKRNRLVFSKDLVSVKDLQRPRISYTTLQQSNSSVCSPIVTSNRGGVPVKYSNMQPGTSTASPANLLADRRKRVVLRNNDYSYEDSDYDQYESPRPGEPLAKKARMIVESASLNSTPRVGYTSSSRVVYTTESPARRTANGYEFNGGMLRGGGRVQPVGDGMRRVVGATGVPQVAAEETVTTSNAPSAGGRNEGDDMPPVISRFDSTAYGGQPAVSSAGNQQRAVTAGGRQVMYATSQRTTPHNLMTAGGKVLMIRKNDGSTQYLRPVAKEEGASPTVRTVSVAQSGAGDQSNGVGGVPVRRIVTAVGSRPGTIVRAVNGGAPTRIVRLGPQNQQMMALPAGTRIVTRVPAANGTAPRASSVTTQAVLPGQTFRRVVQPRQIGGEYVGDEAFSGEFGGDQVVRRTGPVARVSQGYSYGRPVQRVVSRGGATMHVGQRMVQVRAAPSQIQQQPAAVVVSQQPPRPQAQPQPQPAQTYCDGVGFDDNFLASEGDAKPTPSQDGFRRMGAGNVRRVTSYREFCMKRGIVDFMRPDSLPARPYRFDFESNEDEERAIAEAIAREEELMRQEEEENKRDQERQWNHPRIIDKFGQVGSAMLHQLSKQPLQFSSNLMPAKDDTSDMKQIKQTLDSLITQVCRWDKQYGWFKAHQKRPKGRVDLDKLKTRRMFSNQRELMLSEHVDRLRKEINKRRTRLENDAEKMAGLPTPWRKTKTKSSKSKPRTQSPAVKEVNKAPAAVAPVAPARVVNPAEISLGGDSLTDWLPHAIPKLEEDELVEDVQPPPTKRVKMEVTEDGGDGGSPRRKVVPKSDRVLRTRMSSHSEAEESSGTGRTEQKKRGRPRKEVVPIDAGQKEEESDGNIEHQVPDGMNPEEPHCICRQPYNPKKFYINCDLCSGWFHGKCVDVTEEATKTMTGWACPSCTEEAQKANEQQPLYCVCQTPYDDTLFYVGCDGCEDWFHPACVGITQAFAESVSEYMCPRCSAAQQEQEEQEAGGYESDASTSSVSVPLSRADYPLVWRVLEVIAEHRMAWPFKEPVDLAQFPNYNEVITHPMDLSTMQKKLERLEYIHLKDFSHDMNQMFENARIFNAKDSPIYLCADTLEKIFEQQLAEVKAEMTNRINQDRRKPSESHTVDSSLDIDTDQLVDVQLDIDPSMYDQLF